MTLYVGADVFKTTEGYSGLLELTGEAVPPVSERAWHAGKETLGTREVCPFLDGSRLRASGQQMSPGAVAGYALERANTVSAKVLPWNDHKDLGEKTRQKSELSIVPTKRANRHPPGACGGKGKPIHHILSRATWQKHRVQ